MDPQLLAAQTAAPRPPGRVWSTFSLVLLLGLGVLTVLVLPDMPGLSLALVVLAALTTGPAAAGASRRAVLAERSTRTRHGGVHHGDAATVARAA